ncbi:hypothetical protein LJC05_03765 [Bacteroides sp. OttesenSCG-928-J23]|nr:hypothetical protein [Bacteroides sp. OttesenSCG-928-N06]MDL2247828.1 hypothetical protein [Bacteroides sp. OttesenSCG-928-J23]MDL2304234.1 hypothetical protein [Bacteroides sp. OttesenSCG-928-D19]
MKESSLNQGFLMALNEKHPQKLFLVNDISRVLKLEKKTVYRRLSGEVPFTANEMGVLASHYGISLDYVMSGRGLKHNYFLFESPILTSISELTKESLGGYTQKMKEVVTNPHCEMGYVLNSIPKFLFCRYKHVVQFLLFKWGYYSHRDSFASYGDVEVPDVVMSYYINMNELFRCIKNSFYIWNASIIYDLVKDIQYFLSIDKVSIADVNTIKEELYQSIDMLEDLAKAGEFEDTGNSFELYTSALDFGPTRLFVCTDQFYMAVCVVNLVQRFSSYEKEMAERAKVAINAIRSASLRISQSAEKERILFFNEQRALVERL